MIVQVMWKKGKSTASFIFQIEDIALSSIEDEYMSAARTSTQAVWLRKLFEEMNVKQAEPIRIFCDNKSTISLSKYLFYMQGVNILISSVII